MMCGNEHGWWSWCGDLNHLRTKKSGIVQRISNEPGIFASILYWIEVSNEHS